MKLLNKEALYKRNQKTAKLYKTLAPIVFWGCMALCIICLILAFHNSFGNLNEITTMLDGKTHTGEELQANYAILIEKYGEWVIGNGKNGFQMVFINIKGAVLGGLTLTCGVGAIIFFACSFLLGRWLFPKLAEKTIQDNQDIVNLTILKEKDK